MILTILFLVWCCSKCRQRSECPEYYRNVLAYACGLAACLGLLTLLTLQCGRRRRPLVRAYTRV